MLQLIGGIPYFYRRFGYGYGLSAPPMFLLDRGHVAAHRRAGDGVQVRDARADDVDALVSLERKRRDDVLRVVRDARTWARIVTAADMTAEKATSVHAPTDIGLWRLKTRSMLRNRAGRPRSEMSSTGDKAAPASAIHRASRANDGSLPARPAAAATSADAPAAPPTNRYAGTSHVHTGGFSSGRPK